MVQAESYTVDGDVVFIDDSKAYISIYPHTIHRSQYVFLNVTSKVYEGQVDFCLGFDKEYSRPKSLELYDPHNITHSRDLSEYFLDPSSYKVNYTFRARNEFLAYYGHVWVYENITIFEDYYDEHPPENVTIGWEWSEIYSHYFDMANWNLKKIFWLELILWRNIRDNFEFQVVNRDFRGMDRWYLSNSSVIRGRAYHLRIWMEIPPRLGEFHDVKYFIAFKPQSESLSEAIQNDHLYYLDPWLTGGWDKRVKITIDSGDVTSPLTDFPVLLYLSSSSGTGSDDVTFIFDEVGSNSLKIAVTNENSDTQHYVEVETWDSGSEKAWLWVKVPSISSSEDTILYLYYDNDHADNTGYVGDDPDDSPSQNVWESNFKLVTHLRDNPDTSHFRDSTSNNNDGTKKGVNEPQEVDGKISEAQDFDGGDDFGTVTDADSLDFPTDFTLECWIKRETQTSYDMILTKGPDTQENFQFRLDANNIALVLMYQKAEGGFQQYTSQAVVVTGEWNHIVVVLESGENVVFYRNGVECGTFDQLGTLVINDVDLLLGKRSDGHNFDGIIDELRLSGVVRGSSWIKGGYETERDHLVDFGSEELFDPQEYERSVDQAYSWNTDLTRLRALDCALSQSFQFLSDLTVSTAEIGDVYYHYTYHIDYSVSVTFLGPRLIHPSFPQFLADKVSVPVTLLIENEKYGGDLELFYSVKAEGYLIKEGNFTLEMGPESQEYVYFMFETGFGKRAPPVAFKIEAQMERGGQALGKKIEHTITVSHHPWLPHIYNLGFILLISLVVGGVYVVFIRPKRREESHGPEA